MYNTKYDAITNLLQSIIDNGEIAGASCCIIKSGKELYRNNLGYANKEKGTPIENNTIFRMFSMTKPVTSVAMMILVERGLVDLNDPLYKYIPAYKNQKVLSSAGLVPATKPITIKNLFNMTSGIPYPDTNNVAGIEINKIFNRMVSDAEKGSLWGTLKLVEAFAEAPLLFNPGEHWLYGVSADILGAVIEVVTGKTFGEFLKDEIFTPLGMNDTGFVVPKEKRDRFAQVYEYNKDKALVPFTDIFLGVGNYSTPSFESGGAGLVSTIDDYAAFTQMLLNDGMGGGKKIISKKSIELISMNHLSEKLLAERTWDSQRGYGYGMLVRTMLNPAEAGCLGSIGEYGWDGWTGNWFMIDPLEKLSAFFMMQGAPGDGYRFYPRLKNIIYSVIDM